MSFLRMFVNHLHTEQLYWQQNIWSGLVEGGCCRWSASPLSIILLVLFIFSPTSSAECKRNRFGYPQLTRPIITSSIWWILLWGSSIAKRYFRNFLRHPCQKHSGAFEHINDFFNKLAHQFIFHGWIYFLPYFEGYKAWYHFVLLLMHQDPLIS